MTAGSDPERLSLGGGALWVTNQAGNSLVRISQVSGSGETLPARGAEPAAAGYHDGLVLVGAAPALAPLPPIQGQELRVVGAGVSIGPGRRRLRGEAVSR